MKRKIIEDSTSTKDTLLNKPIFKTKRYYRKHSKFSKDNLLSRIKSNFMKSLIIYLNKLIRAYYGKQRLRIRNIDAKINSCTSKVSNNDIFQKRLITLFIDEGLNHKYIRVNEDNYKNGLKKLIEKKDKPILQNFLNKTYKEVIQKFYLQNEDVWVYTELYEVEKDEILHKKLCGVKMETFDKFVEGIKIKEYKTALNDFSKEIFTYVQPVQPKDKK